MSRIDNLNDPTSPDGKDVLTPPNRTAWRRGLASNHERQEGLWIVYR